MTGSTSVRAAGAVAGLFGIVAVAAAAVQWVAVPVPAIGADDKGQGWQAVAPGLVEARSGEVKIAAPVIGRVSAVAVGVNDKVVADEPLIRLDDAEARARVAAAEAQVAMRKHTRNEKSAGKAADRRKAEDAVADAEAALIAARSAFDQAAPAKHGGSDAGVASAHAAWTKAQGDLDQRRLDLRNLENQSDTPLPTQSEGELNAARSELRLAVAELEKLTIRAPIAGTVLQLNIKVGELAAPTAAPLILLGDLSALRVRAEVDEQDVGKIKPGDKVVIRADAFRGRDFAGKVTAVAPIIRPGRISALEQRSLTDVNVAEVLIDVADPGPLVVGMKVDAYFQSDGASQ
jgi:HlyD family secretion protein